MIGGDLSIDTEKYQGVLISQVYFPVSIEIYMLLSNSVLNIGKKEGYNDKVLVKNSDMKIGSNRDKNRDGEKLTPPDVPKTVISADQHEHKKMLTERHNDEKLAIILLNVGAGLIAYHF